MLPRADDSHVYERAWTLYVFVFSTQTFRRALKASADSCEEINRVALQWRNQFWQSLEESAGKRCSECGINQTNLRFMDPHFPFSSLCLTYPRTAKSYHFQSISCLLIKARGVRDSHSKPGFNNNNNEYLERLTAHALSAYTFFTNTYCQNAMHTT